MDTSLHHAWSLVRFELGIALVSLLLLVLPVILRYSMKRRAPFRWSRPADAFDIEGEPIEIEGNGEGDEAPISSPAVSVPRTLWEARVLPLALLVCAGFWVGLPSLRALLYVEKGNEWCSRQYAAKAAGFYRKSLRIAPDSAAAHRGLAVALSYQGNVDEAIHQFRLSVGIEPDNAGFYEDLAQYYSGLGRFNEAARFYITAVELNPGSTVLRIQTANCLISAGRVDEATDQLRIAVTYDRGSMEAHFNLANCLQVKGDIEGAIAEYQAVLQKYPGSAAVHNNLGSLYVTMNKRDKAANEFSQALQIDPSQTISYFNLAKSLQAIGHRPQAMDNYSQFVIKAQTNTQLSTAVNESRKQMRLLKAAIDRSASS